MPKIRTMTKKRKPSYRKNLPHNTSFRDSSSQPKRRVFNAPVAVKSAHLIGTKKTGKKRVFVHEERRRLKKLDRKVNSTTFRIKGKIKGIRALTRKGEYYYYKERRNRAKLF